LVDPTDNSVNEKISRIREAFGGCHIGVKGFMPIGQKGEGFAILVNRRDVIWKNKN
jgi:hypothetical protein